MRTNGRRGSGDGQLFADHLGAGWSSFRLSKTHELGLSHAPCNITAGSDWPYGSNATIQEYGYDVAGLSLENALALIPRTRYDFMSYCGDSYTSAGGAEGQEKSWISPYHYEQVFKRLSGSSARAAEQIAFQQQSSPQDLLLVSGLVHRDGSVNFAPFYHVDTTPLLPQPGSNYCLEFEDGAGGSLASYCFNLEFIDHHTGQPTDVEDFAWTLPYPVGTSRFVLKQGTNILGQVLVSAHTPTITITSPSPGQVWNGNQTITWTASDLDNDKLTYFLLYSPDDGQSWVPLSGDVTTTSYAVNTNQLAGGDKARLRLLVSDGINTSIAEVGLLNVPRKVPRVTILSPQSDSAIRPGNPCILWGDAYDLEDGTLNEDTLHWISSRDGDLGTGHQISAALSPGRHVITLTATDSDGNTTSTTSTIFVGYRTYLSLTSN